MNTAALGLAAEAVGEFNALATSQIHVVTDDLVAMPFRKGMFQTGKSGAGSAPSVNGAFPENDDGTQTGMLVTVPASATWANVATLNFWVSGRVVGLRLLRNSTYGGNPVGCLIDGVASTVKYSALVTPTGQSTTNTERGIGWQIFADDLDDGPHFVELVFPCDISVSRSWAVLGFVAERRAGYVPPTSRTFVNLTAAPAAIGASFVNFAPASYTAYGFRKMFLYNSTGSPIVAQVRYSSGNGVFWSKSVAAGDTETFDPGAPLPHAIDVGGNGLTATPVLVI